MSHEASATKMWLTNICQFFRLPNPRILTLFIISSTTSFSLGVAMIVQWVLHGQYHQGFHWMVYSASAVTSLPILIWIMFMLFAICSHASPLLSSNNNNDDDIVHLSESQKTFTHDHEQRYTDTEAATATATKTTTAATVEPTANVKTEIINEHQYYPPVGKSPMPVSQPRKRCTDDNDKQALKRTLSLPLFHVRTEYYVGGGGSNFRRSMSLKQ